MKKILAVLLSFILVISLCACGNSTQTNNPQSSNKTNTNIAKDVKATVVNKNGTTESLTAKELCDIQDENPIKFDNNYWSAKVTVTGTITKIGGLSSINGTDYKWYLKIEGGDCDWFIGDQTYNTSTVTEDFIANLSIGDTVEISGEIVGHSFVRSTSQTVQFL